MRKTNVQGATAEGFEQVREEFTAVCGQEQADPGAQLAVYVNGRLVVDLWAGSQVSGDSLTGVLSSSKGATYLVVALLVQEGVLTLDQAVAHFWPEFGAEGKADITLRDLLTHRAGVIGVDGGFTTEELADDRLIARRLAGQRPYWKPGFAYGYHALVIGALLGEVVRRTTSHSLQEIYEERIRGPYGLDLYLGLPETLESRYVQMQPWLPTPPQQAALEANGPDPHSLPGIAINLNAIPPFDIVQFINTRAVRALGQSSVALACA